MALCFRYSRRTLALLAIVIGIEYAIVHRISLDALHRSDAGLAGWKQLVSNCNCVNCEPQRWTLIHDGLYQRAYSVHLLHRVLTISSEDGDPYDAYEAAEGEEDGEEEGQPEADGGSGSGDTRATYAQQLSADAAGSYAFAPRDMLSPSIPVTMPASYLASAASSSSPSSSSSSGANSGAISGGSGGVGAVQALPSGGGSSGAEPAPPRASSSPHPPRTTGADAAGSIGNMPHGDSASSSSAPFSTFPTSTSTTTIPSDSGAPRLLQAVVWQPGKVLSLFPWQLRAHFFLSLASTRMYLLMGLWPRAAAVAAAAPRRLRGAPSPAGTPGYGGGMGYAAGGGGGGGGGAAAAAGSHGASQAPYGGSAAEGGGVAGSGGGAGAPGADGGAAGAPAGPGGVVYTHPHAQAQATAHAFAQHTYHQQHTYHHHHTQYTQYAPGSAHHHHAYDGLHGTGGAAAGGGGMLYGLGRPGNSDESQSLAAALSALGRGVPAFLPPEMLVEHGVQEDLMASCVFRPAVRASGGAEQGAAGGAGGGGAAAGPGGAAAGGPGGEAGGAGGVVAPLKARLTHWRRVFPSLLRGWLGRLAGSIKHHGGRAAAALRHAAGGGGGGGAGDMPQLAPAANTSATTAPPASTPTTPSLESSAAGVAGAPPQGAPGQDQQRTQQHHQQPPPSSHGHQGPHQGGLASGHYAYVECRLYRTDRGRNASTTCPAILTVLPSPPPRRSGVSRLLQRVKAAAAAAATGVLTNKQPVASASAAAASAAAAAAAASGSNAGAGADAFPSGQHRTGSSSSSSSSSGGRSGSSGGATANATTSKWRALVARLAGDVRHMAAGAAVPYKWAPILAGLLSPHLFLLACLPAVRALGLMGPFTARLCAYHAVCLLLTAADHLLLLRLAAEVWVRLRRPPRGAAAVAVAGAAGVAGAAAGGEGGAEGGGGGGAGEGPVAMMAGAAAAAAAAGRERWRRWLAWWQWLLLDGFLSAGYGFRLVVMGILTSKQMELWTHLYGPHWQPHPLLSCCLVLPASWLLAVAGTSAAWRLTGGPQPTSVPLLLFQEGFLSGLSSPLYSLVYITFAVLGLGGGGVGGGAGGVLGLAAAGSRLPLWLLDAAAVSPLLAVVSLDVLWNMDTAARASPLLCTVVTALRAHSVGPPGADGGPGGVGLGGRRRGGGGGRGGRLGGGGGGVGRFGGGLGEWEERLLLGGGGGGGGGLRDVSAMKHTSLWMLLEQARWWAHQVRDAAEEQRQQQPGGPVVGGRAVGAVARVALAARHAGVGPLPPRAVAAMMAALLLPLPEPTWPARQREHYARALDLLLAAAAAPIGAAAAAAGRRRRAFRGGAGLGLDDVGVNGGGGGGLMGDGDDDGEDEELEEDEDDLGLGGGGGGNGGGGGDAVVQGILDEVVGAAGGGGGGGAGGGAGQGRAQEGAEGGEGAAAGGERLVRTASGGLRPLSALEGELRAGLAQVAALRSQLAAVGRGVRDLLLLGRWPPPLQLPPEAHGWTEQVPHGFLCPITHSLMTQPALLVSPQLSEASPTYELAAIRQWLKSNRTDPTTGRFLSSYHFIHNDNLRKAIEDWVADRVAAEAAHAQLLEAHAQELQRLQQQQQQQQAGAGRTRPLSPHARPQRSTRRSTPLSPVATATAAAAVAAAAATATANGACRSHHPHSPLGTPMSAAATATGAASCYSGGGRPAAAAVAAAPGGRYGPVDGPMPGQRSVCVGTSELLAARSVGLRSPQRLGRPAGDWEGGVGRSRGGRSRSRGRPLTRSAAAAEAEAAGGGGGGTEGPAAAAARQVVQRAVSRQRGLTGTRK